MPLIPPHMLGSFCIGLGFIAHPQRTMSILHRVSEMYRIGARV